MKDNEKAAIAGRLWEPGQICRCHLGAHVMRAPDMHDSANLWRAVKNVYRHVSGEWRDHFVEAICDAMWHEDDTALFVALVDLYDAEHPNG